MCFCNNNNNLNNNNLNNNNLNNNNSNSNTKLRDAVLPASGISAVPAKHRSASPTECCLSRL